MAAERNPADRVSRRSRWLWIVLVGTVVTAALVYTLVGRDSGFERRAAEAHFLQAQQLASQGREQEAIAAIDAIESPADLDVAALIDAAVRAQRQNKKQLAISFLNAANYPGPRREEVLRMLISLQWDLEEFGSVLMACEELTKLAPQDSMPWLVSAGIYHENERVTEALNAYRQALRRDIPAAEIDRVHYQIADLSLFTGDLATARQFVDLLIKAEPKSLEFSLIQARLLRQEGKPKEQLAVIQQILKEHPNHATTLMMRGENYLDSGLDREALEDFEIVVQSNPYDYQAHYKLAQAYMRVGNTQQAESHFTRSRELTEIINQTQVLLFQVQQDPNNRQLRLQLATLSEQQGDQETAEYWRSSAQHLTD